MPALGPAFVLAAVLLLPGCSLLKPSNTDDKAAPGTVMSGPQAAAHAEGKAAEDGKTAKEDGEEAPARDAFSLEVRGPDEIKEFLERHLELQRYRQIPDLGPTELSRLLGAADANARELLGTLGYFAPTLTIERRSTPANPKAPQAVVVTVDPGRQTLVLKAEVQLRGPINEDASQPDPEGRAPRVQRDAVRNGWSLRPGAPFSQDAWDTAKTTGLRRLTAERYPTARIADSRADIDADTGEARLSVDYDSGPAYRFGPMQVQGAQRYDPAAAPRLARLPVGAWYDQAKLLEAQQRLASSGYYDSVFLLLDTQGADPLAAPVTAQVREAPLKKVVLGVGISTDSGPRVSVDHIHNKVPGIGWRAVSKLSADAKTKLASTELTSLPDEEGWRWVTSGLLQREIAGSYEVNSGRLRGGRSKLGDRIDRNYFLQYDIAKNQGLNAPPSASAITANYGWTGRYFDSNTQPTRGNGLALELGAGFTLTPERDPFTRLYARWLGFRPLGEVQAKDGTAARQSRLALRAEAGAVLAKDSATIPTTQLFLTGGDTTVRGYSYRQIGARTVDNTIYAGRYLGVASIEYQRPIVWDGKMTEFEGAAFIDAGAVADKTDDLVTRVGVGVGVRWRSPVGPLQADIAYGEAVKKFRLHLRLGFSF